MKKPLLIAVVLAVIATGGWLYTKNQNVSAPTDQSQTSQQSNDPSEDGKYLVIKEWGIRFPLPNEQKSKATYEWLGDIKDEDGITFQVVRVLIVHDSSLREDCNLAQKGSEKFINTGTQLIRIDKGAAFNLSRYKGSSTKNAFSDSRYSYHINSTSPNCANDTLANLIRDLEVAIKQLGSI